MMIAEPLRGFRVVAAPSVVAKLAFTPMAATIGMLPLVHSSSFRILLLSEPTARIELAMFLLTMQVLYH